MPVEPARRKRDPDRRERIIAAAAELTARRGFHSIGMAEIGAEAGIVGSGIYRHFGSKTDILVAVLDQAMTRLQAGAATVAAAGLDDRESLSALIRDHIAVCTQDRTWVTVYHREAHNIPEPDRRRLRRAQRHYVEEWVHLLAPLRPELADAELRLCVHAAIGAIQQSSIFFRSGLAPERQAELLGGIVHGCLGISESQLTNL